MSSFPLTSSNLLMFSYLGFLQKRLCILAPPLPLQSSPSELSERLYPGLIKSLVILQIKHNSQVLGCAFFFSVDSLGDHKGTQSRLPSFAWTLGGTRALVPAEASCAHSPPWRVQMNLGESLLVLRSPDYWLMFLSFNWQCTIGTWLPSWKIRGGTWLKDIGKKYLPAERY